MATLHPIDVDTETESQTDSETLEPQLLKKRKPAAGRSQISQNI